MTHEPEDMPVLDALGRAVPQVAPPPALRARVLAAIAGEAGGAGAASPDIAPTNVTDIRPRLADGRTPAGGAAVASPGASRWPWLLAAAAAFVAIGTSFGWISARTEVARLQQTISELRTSAAALLNVRADFDREQSARQRAASILSASDVQSTALAGVTPADGARGRVYMSPSRGLLMAADNLPPLPQGRVYQLWTIVAGQPVSHGIFELDADGRAQILAQAPPGPPQAFAVTLEPAGGVPSPTGAKVLLGAPAN